MAVNSVDAEEIHLRWLSAMRAGDFEAAWKQTDRIESRRRFRANGSRVPGELRWDGTPFRGRRVLIRCLHGLGDTVQFARFVPLVRHQAKEVIFAVQPPLVPLFASDKRFGSVVNGWADDSFPNHDVEIEVMELAYAVRATSDTLPAPPYLDAESIAGTSNWIPPTSTSRPRVGLLWKSSCYDPGRSVPPSALGLLDVGVTFYSLQQDVSDSERMEVSLSMENLAIGTREIADAAKAMLWLDLIISVDGMPAHLAGALNRPVWVLLKHNSDWRWMNHREDSPWYPSMRLFRQQREDDWDGVFRKARYYLELIATGQFQLCSRKT